MNATMLLGGLALIAIGIMPADFARRLRDLRLRPVKPKAEYQETSVVSSTIVPPAPSVTATLAEPEAAPGPPKLQGTNVNFLRSIIGKKPAQTRDQGPIGAPLDPPDDPYGDDVLPQPLVPTRVEPRPVEILVRERETQEASPTPAESETTLDFVEHGPIATPAPPATSVPFRLATTLTRAPFEPPIRRAASSPDTTQMPSWLREAVEETPSAQTRTHDDHVNDEDDDAALDSTTIFGSATASAEERALWEQELAEEASARDASDSPEVIVQAPPDFVAQHSFAVRVIEPETVAIQSAPEATVEHSQPQIDDAELTTTWDWIQFLGDDVQTLGAAERENLIRMIAEMHDDDMLPVLVKAFGEEKPDGLRLEVLKAIMTFDHPIVAELVVYVHEHGSEAERSYVSGAAQT